MWYYLVNTFVIVPYLIQPTASYVCYIDDRDYLPAILGMATGHMIEKSQQKARNLLKQVAKMEVSKHDGEDFEKANLLIAKFYADKVLIFICKLCAVV